MVQFMDGPGGCYSEIAAQWGRKEPSVRLLGSRFVSPGVAGSDLPGWPACIIGNLLPT